MAQKMPPIRSGRIVRALPAWLLATLAACAGLQARQISPSTPPPPPTEARPAEAEPVFDPFHAEKSMEIGGFYMKKGNYDAAIDRFEEAARYQPKLARPWKLIGEAAEKKRDYTKAVEGYKRYLELLPRAEDAAAVTRRIDLLQEKLQQQKPSQQAARRPPH